MNGPNLILSELVNNIDIFQRATAKIGEIDFHESLTLFIRRLFASKRTALPKRDSSTGNSLIQVARRLELPSDHSVVTYLNTTSALNRALFKTC